MNTTTEAPAPYESRATLQAERDLYRTAFLAALGAGHMAVVGLDPKVFMYFFGLPVEKMLAAVDKHCPDDGVLGEHIDRALALAAA